MRTLLIPALALIMGYPAYAHDEHREWKYRSHREQRSERWRENDTPERRGWDRPRFERRNHDRLRYHERDVVVIDPLPIPPPPTLGIHLWFGF
jgi:hypothetical protein